MKNFITLLLLSISLAGYSQSEKKVEKNDQKINELNERLDNLLGGSKSIEGDSVEFKLDLLMREIRTIKSEMSLLKTSVDELKNGNDTKLNSLSKKMYEIENGEYYVVIASAIDQRRSNTLLKEYSKNMEVAVVQNERGSWYHIILKESTSMADAISKTAQLRTTGFKDAWWVTGRKLTIK